MSNLQPNCCLKFDFQKVDQHAGGKWLIPCDMFVIVVLLYILVTLSTYYSCEQSENILEVCFTGQEAVIRNNSVIT